MFENEIYAKDNHRVRGGSLLDVGLLGDIIRVSSPGAGEGHSPGRRVSGGKLR